MRPIVAALLLAYATPALALPTAGPLHEAFVRYRLPNGLTVILHEDHRVPTVVVDLWFRVGSKDEKLGRSGFAHLFEHLMFMGTKNVPNGKYDSIMEAAGGVNNATTSEDRTNYFEWGPANLLDTFLWLEADRLATLTDDMTKEKVDLQRDVVKNERRQSYENRPYGGVELALPDKLYPESHPYHRPVIGSHADLTAATVEDVKQFFHDYYVPSNASLVVSGDFATKKARALVEKYFAWMPKRPEPPHATPARVQLDKPERVKLTDAVQLERLVLAWHSPAWFAPGDAECDLLAAVLGAGKSSRLYQSLVYDKKLAESVEVQQRGHRYASEFVIIATALPGHTAAELEHAVDAELARLEKQPPTTRELDGARSFVETQLLRQLESPFEMADTLNYLEFLFGDPAQLGRLLRRYDAVAVEGLAQQAHAVLSAPRVAIEVAPAAPAPKGGAK